MSRDQIVQVVNRPGNNRAPRQRHFARAERLFVEQRFLEQVIAIVRGKPAVVALPP